MKIIDQAEVIAIIQQKLAGADVRFHPDGENTFAAYQVILPEKFELWINARNGDLIHASRLINRL